VKTTSYRRIQNYRKHFKIHKWTNH